MDKKLEHGTYYVYIAYNNELHHIEGSFDTLAEATKRFDEIKYDRNNKEHHEKNKTVVLTNGYSHIHSHGLST